MTESLAFSPDFLYLSESNVNPDTMVQDHPIELRYNSVTSSGSCTQEEFGSIILAGTHCYEISATKRAERVQELSEMAHFWQDLLQHDSTCPELGNTRSSALEVLRCVFEEKWKYRSRRHSLTVDRVVQSQDTDTGKGFGGHSQLV